MAVKKALYKPAAFYKGIILPLAEVCVRPWSMSMSLRNCTVRWLYVSWGCYHWKRCCQSLCASGAQCCSLDETDAASLQSSSCSFHKSTCEQEVQSAIRGDRFIGGSFHELHVCRRSTPCPVASGTYWMHCCLCAYSCRMQCLLVFAQRYRQDVTREQKERLRSLLKTHFHYMITPEIRRELFQGPCRGDIVGESAGAPQAAAQTAENDDSGLYFW